MKIKYQNRYASHPDDVKQYDTELLRKHFLIDDLFCKDEISLVYSHFDRFIIGGIFPVTKALTLESIDILRSTYFTERRELGILNIGGIGIIKIGDEKF